MIFKNSKSTFERHFSTTISRFCHVFGGKIEPHWTEENKHIASERTNKCYKIWIDVPKLSTVARSFGA